jgi:hypothetical protein
MYLVTDHEIFFVMIFIQHGDLQTCALPHEPGLPLNFSLQGGLQGLRGAVYQHPPFCPGDAGVDNLPGEQPMVFIIGQDQQDVIKL